MSKNKRNKEHIELGLLPMSGEIVKHKQFVNGIPSSYLSVNLKFVLPQDLDDVIKSLQSEMECVKTELQETIKLLSS
jgi:hypothetical protein